MEDTYRSSMLKTFKKTLDDGFFPFIILDTINDRVKHFDQFWSAAKTKGFEVSCVHEWVRINVSAVVSGLKRFFFFSYFKVYLAEMTADTQTCAKRNVHGRTLKDIMKVIPASSLRFIYIKSNVHWSSRKLLLYLLMDLSMHRCPTTGSLRHVIWCAWMSGPCFRMLPSRRCGLQHMTFLLLL